MVSDPEPARARRGTRDDSGVRAERVEEIPETPEASLARTEEPCAGGGSSWPVVPPESPSGLRKAITA